MLSENIKNLRKKKGLTQEELAMRLHVVRQTVSRWEKGLSVPDAVMLQKLAEELDTDVSYLLGMPVEQQSSGEIAQQLSRINEQLAIKNRRAKRIWTVVGVLLALWLGLHLIGAVLSYALISSNESTTIITNAEVEIVEESTITEGVK